MFAIGGFGFGGADGGAETTTARVRMGRARWRPLETPSHRSIGRVRVLLVKSGQLHGYWSGIIW